MSLIFKESDQKQDFHSSKEISEAEKNKVLSNLKKMPMTFITNSSQIDSKVKYYVKGRNFGFYFTIEEAVLSFIKGASKKNSNKNPNKGEIPKEEEKGIGVALALNFIDANPNVKIEGQAKGIGKINYLKGNDPKKWYTDLSTYEKVVYKELWKGIDLVFYGEKDKLKYEFTVHPGADFNDIKLSYKGADGISLDEEGNLLIKNELGVLIDEHPISYQEIEGRRVAIDSRFVVKSDENMESTYSFEIEKSYNPDYPIVIDPGLIYSTYLGGSSIDNGNSIAIDNTGSAYVTGTTSSANFPTTVGAFQPAIVGGNDAFVTKLNPAGTALIYSTYLGGSNTDVGTSIAIDNTDSAYVIGFTDSADFPTTAGAFQPAIAGGNDAFVTKLNPAGTALIYSTYLGGSSFDSGNDIAVDNTGSAYVTGRTDSGDFPTTAGAFQTVFGGVSDAFVTKLNATGTALIYSTYLGGSSSDFGIGIAVDNTGSAYVTGSTNSLDFPTTAGAFQSVFGGAQDAFVTKLNATGTGLIYSTYLGGSSIDFGNGIAIDNTGSAYVTGATDSIDFPTTAGAFQPASGGARDAFVTKLNPAGSGLIYSTYLGGSSTDFGNGIEVDSTGSAYVTGQTSSVDFPITAEAFQTTFGGGPTDAFVTKLNAASTGLIYSTYLGGSSSDFGNGIAVDNTGSAYVTGQTSSVDFPITPGAFQPAIGGGSDSFVTKINTNTVSPRIRITNQNIAAIVYDAG